MATIITMRQIFEGGLEFSSHDCCLPLGKRPTENETPALALANYGVRLVAIERDIPFSIPGALQLPPVVLVSTVGPGFGSMFMRAAAGLDNHLLFDNVQYEFLGAYYHCKNLAVAYAEACREAHAMGKIMAGDSYSGGNTDDIYYEFDAVVTKARRALDRLSEALWKQYVKKGDGPNNIAGRLADERSSAIPEKIRKLLRTYWENEGKRIRDYRDGVQHFAKMSGIDTPALFSRVVGESWKLLAAIPDNPEAKSQSKYTFNSERDALTYSWELINSLGQLISEVVDEMVPAGSTDRLDQATPGPMMVRQPSRPSVLRTARPSP